MADVHDRPDDLRALRRADEDKPQVMVVEDDPSMRRFLEAFLSARGFSPIALEDAEVREAMLPRK